MKTGCLSQYKWAQGRACRIPTRTGGFSRSLATTVLFLLAWIAGTAQAVEPAQPLVIMIAREGAAMRAVATQIETAVNQDRRDKVRLEFVVFVGDVQKMTDEALAEYLRPLVARKPLAFISPNFDLARAAVAAKINVPFIVGGFADPRSIGVVPRLSDQGVAVTGYTANVPSIDEKRLSILKEAFPGLRHVGILVDHTIKRTRTLQTNGHFAYALQGARTTAFEIKSAEEGIALIRRSKSLGIDAWYVRHMLPILLQDEAKQKVIDAINQQGLPSMYDLSRYAELGGLMSYRPYFEDRTLIWIRDLKLILEGVPASAIPFERPRHVHFTLNTNTAAQLKVNLPSQVARRLNALFPCTGDATTTCGDPTR